MKISGKKSGNQNFSGDILSISTEISAEIYEIFFPGCYLELDSIT